MKSGLYTLIIKLEKQVEIEVGKLGILELKKGYYAYTGSALGRAGFKRINRHLNIDKKKKKRWHIDYLLEHSEVVEVFKLECGERGKECEMAAEIGRKFEAIKAFGSSDCKCKAHLHYSPSLELLRRFIAELFDSNQKRVL